MPNSGAGAPPPISPSWLLGGFLFVAVSFILYRWQRKNAHRLKWSDNDLLYLSFVLWGVFWATINGGGIANFALNGLDWLEAQTALSIPAALHDPVLWFLIGLFPSLDQFLFQANPAAVLSRYGKLARALLLSGVDGMATAFGVYWLAIPLSSGEPFNGKVFAIAAAIGFFGCYVCQYELHAKAYEIAGLEMPEIPLPPVLSSILAMLGMPLVLLSRLFGPRLTASGVRSKQPPPAAVAALNGEGGVVERLDPEDLFVEPR